MSYGMDGWNKPGGDLISIQDAIDLLDEQIAICNRALTNPSISMNDEFAVNVERNSLMAYRVKLECMPSAQPERNTGEWREHIFDGIMGRRPRALMCTNCNVISIYASNFCPNCGAKMGGSE